MEINKSNFMSLMQPWLHLLSTSCFVSIDLELSGIPAKVSNDSSKQEQTLEQRYEEAKLAAEKYQVLQVGFTVMQEDVDSYTYLAFPYNVLVNPLLDERIGIQRDFSFQGEAVRFLMKHGFHMDGPFHYGVPYLSRDEAKEARDAKIASLNRTYTNIVLKPNDTSASEFVQRTREQIKEWERLTPRPGYLNIGAEGVNAMESTANRLNNFQKRLVHQLIRTEFPNLRSAGRLGFMQIFPYDIGTEKAILKAKMETFDESLRRQTGIRYFVEGMVGGQNLELINPKEDYSQTGRISTWVDVERVKNDFEELRKRLQGRPTVLVGHNLFLDLVNFYQCFFGKLPDTVEDFGAKIHELFPLVIDTKYMASALQEDRAAKSGLEELDEALGKMRVPNIRLEYNHLRYEHNRYPHEAGYDSYSTAKVFLRLASKLAARAIWEPDSEAADEPATAEGTPSKPKNKSKKKAKAKGKDKLKAQFATSNMYDVLGGSSDNESEDESQPQTVGLELTEEEYPTSEQDVPSTEHVGVWKDSITPQQKEDQEGYAADSDEEYRAAREGHTSDSETMSGSSEQEHDGSQPRPNMTADALGHDEEVPPLIPCWDSEFWQYYGNKVVVNGTEEGFFYLAQPDADG